MNPRRILVVDDEPSILCALQNLLRKQRRVWDMTFVAGGAAALAELEKGPYDVIVSDMRMPGMDGAELLGRVRAGWPATARIVLSGHAERSAVVRALGVAHQFLAKPCDFEALRGCIERTCRLQALLAQDAVRAVVGRLHQLPSTPKTYWELTQVLADPAAGVGALADVIERDPAMSIKVLQLVNSAFFGLAQPVASSRRAVAYLGVELLRGLALSAHVFASLAAAPAMGFSIDDHQREALSAAQLARRFLADPVRAELAFTAALVHDVGKLIVAVAMPEAHAAIAATARRDGRTTLGVERELLGVSHAEIGGYLLGVWGLPFAIVEAVAFHHRPDQVSEAPMDVLAAVHVAGWATSGGIEGDLDEEFLERAGLLGELPRWLELAHVPSARRQKIA
jgi:HD-like signal output (HDOD) protein